jgi:cysteine desulfuration protein SufE
MTARERAEAIVQEMNLLPEGEERFMQVIRWGKRSPGLPDSLKTDTYRIEGCQSMLWMVPELREGRCYFSCDSDAFITKGVSSILCYVYSGATPQEVVDLPMDFMERAGITQHLSPNRSNGLAQIGRKIREFAAQQLATA